MTRAADLVTVEIALSTSPFDLAPGWTDLSALGLVASVSWSGGRATPTGQFSPSVASITVDNVVGIFDPLTNLLVRPNLPVRISVTADGNVRRRFYGFVDAGATAYGFPDAASVTFTATDGQKFLARETNLGLSGVPAEPTGTRVGRIADAVGWPATWRDIDTGSVTMAAEATLATDALSALSTAVASEGVMSSSWFIDRPGLLRFDSRHALATRHRSATVQASFSNIEADIMSGSFIGFSAPTGGVSEAAMANKATVTGADGVAASATDAASVTANGPLRFADTTHRAVSSSQADVDARVIVSMFADPQHTVTAITVVMVGDSARFDTVAQVELRDRVRVKFDHPDGTSSDQEYFIESISETAGTDGRWTATYGLSPAARWDALGAASWLVVGVGKVGVGKVGI